MSYLRFNHVFFGLLALAFVSAMFLPASVSRSAQANIQLIFAPISSPIRGMASWTHSRFVTTKVRDDGSPGESRADVQLVIENNQLRQQLALLSTELQKLQAVDAHWDRLSWLRGLCTPVTVVGGDSGQGGLLHLQISSLEGIKPGMAAIVPDGLVGRIDRAGPGGASIQLLTARGTRLGIKIGRIVSRNGKSVEFQSHEGLNSIAASQGDGTLLTELMKWEDLDQGVQVNDWVVLEDAEWPGQLLGYRVGRVIERTRDRHAPAWGRVRFEPVINLMQLREVMVLNKAVNRQSSVVQSD